MGIVEVGFVSFFVARMFLGIVEFGFVCKISGKSIIHGLFLTDRAHVLFVCFSFQRWGKPQVLVSPFLRRCHVDTCFEPQPFTWTLKLPPFFGGGETPMEGNISQLSG